MKSYFIVFMLVIVSFLSCNDDDETNPDCPGIVKGTGKYLRLTAHSEVSCVPEERRVRILVRAADSLNVGQQGLTISDFVILENCTDKVNDKESEANIDPRTISTKINTILLLDISYSIEGMTGQIKQAALELINSKVSNQEFAIYTFDSDVTLVQDFTSDVALLTTAINSIPDTGLDKSTNLYQAIIDASKKCRNEIGINEIINGSMIIFTDGKHNADPGLKIADAVNATKGKNVYVAALKGDLDEVSLQQIAGQPSNYLYVDDVTKLKESFLSIQAKVENESKSTYFLNYVSPISVDGIQNLRVLIKNNSNIGSDAYIDKTFSTKGF